MSQLTAIDTKVQEPEFSGLFPLKLSPVERFLFEDSCEQYPMMCDGELYFKGTIQRDSLETALEFALSRAPLFRSIISFDKKNGYHWQTVLGKPSIDWADLNEPYDQGYNQHIDLTSEPGLRIYVRAGEEQSKLLLHFHHACSDGIGAFAFIEDLLTAYANAVSSSEKIEPRKLEPERLLNRCNSVLETSSFKQKTFDLFLGVRECIRFFFQNPLSLNRHLPSKSLVECQRDQTCFSLDCSPAATSALRTIASQSKITLNDILLRDMYLALDNWFKAHGTKYKSRRIRILMPQNLRSRGDIAMPAANDLGFAFMTRKVSMCEQPETLQESIAAETAAVRLSKYSRYFIGGLETVQQVNLMKYIVSTPLCFSTAILSNLGNSWRRFEANLPRKNGEIKVGNLAYERLVGLPPVRRNTSAAFSVTTSATQLLLNLRCDPNYFNVADAKQLLEMYHQQLCKTVEKNQLTNSVNSNILSGNNA